MQHFSSQKVSLLLWYVASSDATLANLPPQATWQATAATVLQHLLVTTKLFMYLYIYINKKYQLFTLFTWPEWPNWETNYLHT